MQTETPQGDAEADPDRAALLVAAAHDLLDEEGLEGLTIRAVLGRTGLARRAFYDRFAGKDDLMLAVFADTLSVAAATFAAHIRRLPDPMRRIEHIVNGIVLGRGIVEAGPTSSRLGAAMSREHLRLAEARPAELQRAVAPLVDLIGAQLAEGMAAGQVRQAPVHRLAVLVYNLVSTTVHTELLAEETGLSDPQRRAQLSEDIWGFCRRAIAA